MDYKIDEMTQLDWKQASSIYLYFICSPISILGFYIYLDISNILIG